MWRSLGYDYRKKQFSHLRFADDIALFSNDAEHLQICNSSATVLRNLRRRVKGECG